MLINESIVFPPGGSKMVPLPFPGLSLCAFPYFYVRRDGCIVAERRSIMILISSNQEPSGGLRILIMHGAAAGDRNITTYSDCVECGAE